MSDMLNAIKLEIKQTALQYPNIPIQTIYFGGGTPSIIPENEIAEIIDIIKELYDVQPNAEITLEANPEDINLLSVENWKNIGIHRLSIGIQSLDDSELTNMNRNHSSLEAKSAVKIALDSGISSVNVDLIFGSPWLSNEAWKSNMKWAFECGADHISAYGLTVEPKTMMNKKIEKGIWPMPSDEKQSHQYQMLHEMSEQYGWDFYEISNLSKPGHRAVHNSNYWKNLPYLGFGPSAHSYNGEIRWWNIADNRKYTLNAENGEFLRQSEKLTPSQKYNEYVLTNIRRIEGIHLSEMKANPLCNKKELDSIIALLISKEQAILEGEHLVLTLKGKLLADWITTQLMI